MSNEYAKAVKELVRAKVEHRAPEIEIADESTSPKVINIMAALKESMQAQGRATLRDAVRKRIGKKPAADEPPRAVHAKKPAKARRSVH
jgi:non-homologous end joining protein Ku